MKNNQKNVPKLASEILRIKNIARDQCLQISSVQLQVSLQEHLVCVVQSHSILFSVCDAQLHDTSVIILHR